MTDQPYPTVDPRPSFPQIERRILDREGQPIDLAPFAATADGKNRVEGYQLLVDFARAAQLAGRDFRPSMQCERLTFLRRQRSASHEAAFG